MHGRWTVTGVELTEPPPRPFGCLHEKVGEALAWLGADVETVLAALHAAGVAGWPGDRHMDPVCRWLAAAVPDLGVQLVGDRLRVWDGRDVALVEIPRPVRGAMRAIAAGEAPRLRLDLQPDPLPGPHLEDLYPRVMDPYLARCHLCKCSGEAPCEGGCRLATGEEIYAAGLDPMDGEVCNVCVEAVAAARRVRAPVRVHAHNPSPPAIQDDTVILPAVPAGMGDRGGVLVRVAVVCGLGALAAFLLAVGGPAQLAGAVVGFSWPFAAILTLWPRSDYPGRHRPGQRPAHAAGVPGA